jgi:hypothetical protein
MAANTMHVRLPALPDPTIFTNPDHTIRTDDGRALLTYDPLTRASFIYVVEQCRWTILAPVDFDTFVLMATVSGYRLADTADARRWLETCGCPPLSAQSARH